jgi:hypothetical protein
VLKQATCTSDLGALKGNVRGLQAAWLGVVYQTIASGCKVSDGVSCKMSDGVSHGAQVLHVLDAPDIGGALHAGGRRVPQHDHWPDRSVSVTIGIQ